MSPFYIFVDLPKTGGTSLRLAAAKQLGWSRILYDYGRREELTSPLVVEWIYERKDPQGFAAAHHLSPGTAKRLRTIEAEPVHLGRVPKRQIVPL